jgi:hypothetical protein
VTNLALLLLLLATAAPLLTRPLRRVVADPVLPVAALLALLLAAGAAVAARVDPVDGWRLAAALVLGVVVATTGGSLVVRAVFRLMRREFLPARVRTAANAAEAPAGEVSQPAEAERPEAVLRGGAWIGYLERAAVAATLLAGWPEGVALVLAVKGVGRYSELRETNAPEAFIIGTLASLLWASSAAGAAHLLR